MSAPMDAQGGEKINGMERLYAILAIDAAEREILRDDFYFLSDEVLAAFKRFQGFPPTSEFPGSRIEQAHLIWAQSPFSMRAAIANANGFSLAPEPMMPSGLLIVFDKREA
jgi:hypothetical protein